MAKLIYSEKLEGNTIGKITDDQLDFIKWGLSEVYNRVELTENQKIEVAQLFNDINN